MAPLRPSGFAGTLSGLDRGEFDGFLVDLWEARGRDARVEDGVLIDDAGERLLVHHAPGWRDGELPATDGRDVDGIVTSRRVDPPRDAVRVIDADDLRDMLLYAVGRPARAAISERYFDRSPATIRRLRDEPDGWLARHAGAVRTAGIVVLVAAMVAVGALGGAPAARDASPGDPTPTAAGRELGPLAPVTPVSPRETPTATPADALVLEETIRTDLLDRSVSKRVAVDDRPLVVEFSHDGTGFFLLWVTDADGTRRLLLDGVGERTVRALVKLSPGRHTLIIEAFGPVRLRVERSRSPPIAAIERADAEYAGPVPFSGRTNVTVRGFDRNATYAATLVDGEGNHEAALFHGTGSSGPVSTTVAYRGRGFVRMNATGRWVIVLEPAGTRTAS